MSNIDELKKELDDLSQQFQDSNNGCEIEDEENENFPDYVIELRTKMLAPARAGVYFSKKEIRDIAQKCGESISLKQRERMLNDLLKSIFNLEDMNKVFDIIKAHIDLKISYYQELSTAYGESKIFFDEFITKAEDLKESLDRILKESDGQIIL